jgi:hypothetical protein
MDNVVMKKLFEPIGPEYESYIPIGLYGTSNKTGDWHLPVKKSIQKHASHAGAKALLLDTRWENHDSSYLKELLTSMEYVRGALFVFGRARTLDQGLVGFRGTRNLGLWRDDCPAKPLEIVVELAYGHPIGAVERFLEEQKEKYEAQHKDMVGFKPREALFKMDMSRKEEDLRHMVETYFPGKIVHREIDLACYSLIAQLTRQ